MTATNVTRGGRSPLLGVSRSHSSASRAAERRAAWTVLGQGRGLSGQADGRWPGTRCAAVISSCCREFRAWRGLFLQLFDFYLLTTDCAPAGHQLKAGQRPALNGEHKACGGRPGSLRIAKPIQPLLGLRVWRRGRSPFPKPRARLRPAASASGVKALAVYADPASPSCPRWAALLLRSARSEARSIQPLESRIDGQTSLSSLRSWRAFQQLDQRRGFRVPSVLASRRSPSAHAASNQSLRQAFRAGPIAKSKHHGPIKAPACHVPPGGGGSGRCRARLAVAQPTASRAEGGMPGTTWVARQRPQLQCPQEHPFQSLR